MNGQDLFVGGLSILLGAVALGAAVGNWSFFFRTRRVVWLESRWGRNGVRVAFAVAGLLLILLGLMIAAGIRVYSRSTPHACRQPAYALQAAVL